MAWPLGGQTTRPPARDWLGAGGLLGRAAARREASGAPTAPVALALIREAAPRAALGAAAAAAWEEGPRPATSDVQSLARPARS